LQRTKTATGPGLSEILLPAPSRNYVERKIKKINTQTKGKEEHGIKGPRESSNINFLNKGKQWDGKNGRTGRDEWKGGGKGAQD